MTLETPTASTAPAAPAAPAARRRCGRPRRGRGAFDKGFAVLCAVAASTSVLVLAVLLAQIGWMGSGYLRWSFFTNLAGPDPETAGIRTAAVGTILISIVCALTAVPIGIATAVLLEEFKPRHWLLQRIHHFVQLNITNLAGVPSVVYGLLGLTAFVHTFALFGTTGAPAWEFGIRFFDRYTTAGGRVLLVPVDSRDAAPTTPETVKQFLDAEENPTTVEVLGGAEADANRAAMRADVSAVQEAVKLKLGKVDGEDRAVIGRALDEAWAGSKLKSQLAPLRENLIDDLVRLLGAAPGSRSARKAKESFIERIEWAEMAARFPDTISAEAVPARQPVTRPWYVRVPFGRSVLAGGLTLMLVILPIIIISCQEALRAVPRSLRQASLAMGATPWQTIRRTTLPAAVPGLMTGVILAMSRAIGEAAPILMVAGAVYISYTPTNLMDGFSAMPLQIYAWVGQPREEFRNLAATGIILLLGVLLLFNGLAIYIRQKTQRQV